MEQNNLPPVLSESYRRFCDNPQAQVIRCDYHNTGLCLGTCDFVGESGLEKASRPRE